MKNYLIFIAIFYGNFAFAQLNETFVTNSGVWTGSNSGNDFVIVSEQLRSNPVTAADYYLSTANSLATNCEWKFSVNLQFNPSGANYVDVYLISDQANLQAANINGYFVRIGNTEDEISLYKRGGTTNTSVKIIDGVDGLLNKTNNNIKIRATRTASGTFTLERDAAGTGYFTEGSVLDLSFNTSGYFGIFIRQSSAASVIQKHFFDDIFISPLITDNTPPKLLSAKAIDSLTIELTFDESIDTISAKNPLNYQIDNTVNNPLTVETTTDPEKYKLKLAKGLNTNSYQITASNIKDKAGNIIASNNIASFAYVKPFIARKGDLVINEIFADPSPQVDLPSVEFIEIVNTSNHTISLKNWKYSDPTSAATFPGDSIKAGEYIILCAKADTNEFKLYGKTIGISPWPSLNNASDIIKLVSPENRTIDSVSYADSWHTTTLQKQGGWSLERIDYASVCTGLFNWASSNDVFGGTPGKQNSIYIENYDQVALKADSIKKLSDSIITVYFNKPVEILNSENAFNLLPASGNIRSASVDNVAKQVKILFSDALKANTTYTLTVNQVKDCAGNLANAETFQFTTPKLPVVRLDTAKIYMTEIFADPSPEVDLPLVEFVEIFNPGTDTIDLNGWTLNDPTTKTTLKNISISPQQYLILCSAADTLQYKPFGKTLGLAPWPSLNNTAEQISLKSFTGRLVDTVSYTDAWYKSADKKSGGWSLEIINCLSLCRGIQNWTASNDPSGGTPGRQNSVTNLYSNIPLKITEAMLKDSVTITIKFNRPPEIQATLKADNYFANNGLGKPGEVAVNADFTQVDLKFAKAISRGNSYRITSSNITDCAGKPVSKDNNYAEFFYPHKILRNDILITEILFNPRSEGVDFVEIYNNSNNALDLKELSIAAIKAPDSIISRKSLSTTTRFIQPKSYLVLSTDPDNIKKEYHTDNPDAFLKMPSMPAFNNDAGTVLLISGDNRIDQFSYNEKMHFSLIKDPKGVSLERSNFNVPANETGNFRSSAASAGYATPGYKNSQFVETAENQTTEVSLLSKTFSPDNDGFEDALQINYHFAEAGLVSNINVYNDKGTLIRRLARNVTITSEGSFFWDGLAEDSQKANVGIYIVTFEVFSLNGKVKKFRKPCVLAAKLD